MRLFLYEHTRAVATSSLEALRTEGQAMFEAVRHDFTQITGVTVITLDGWDPAAFRRAARQADFTLVIAPESQGILAQLCAEVEDVGGRLLGPSAAAVRLCADKLALSRFWHRHGVPTPPCRLVLPGQPLPTMLWPAVYKPRYGAGSQATFLVRSAAEVALAFAQAQAEGVHDDFLLQPLVPGQAASVAWLTGPQRWLSLLPAEQHLSRDGRFHYQGGRLPLAPSLTERALRLTRHALAGLPGLLGYVGVDIVLGEAADGSQDQAIEVNPRFTTSYLGLRVQARTNLAQVLLDLVQGTWGGKLAWEADPITFRTDGHIQRLGHG